MNKTSLAANLLSVAVAACSYSLPPQFPDDRIVEIQLTPAGAFRPNDGREMKVAAWTIDAGTATKVIARFNARKNPPVVDYEHQTLHKETNGQPAPAAAWMRALQWREGSGLWATVELTPQAAEQIRSGEYRYISPVFLYDEKTGEVLAIEMAAITNTPAIDGMQAMSLRAAATFAFHPDPEESSMTLLEALLAALGLPASTTEDQAIAACSALQAHAAALNAQLGAEGSAAIAACTALKTKAAGAAPDPAKFVPISVVEELQGQVAALSAKHTAGEVAALVDAGLADGRILPSMKDWATDLGKSNVAALTSYLEKAAPIAALTSSQTGGAAPAVKDENGLTAAELAVCSQTGISAKDFAAARPQA